MIISAVHMFCAILLYCTVDFEKCCINKVLSDFSLQNRFWLYIIFEHNNIIISNNGTKFWLYIKQAYDRKTQLHYMTTSMNTPDHHTHMSMLNISFHFIYSFLKLLSCPLDVGEWLWGFGFIQK